MPYRGVGHYQNIPGLFTGGIPRDLEVGALQCFEDEPRIGADSRKHFFGVYCRCIKCLASVSNQSPDLPCWYKSKEANGIVIKRILYNDVVHSEVL